MARHNYFSHVSLSGTSPLGASGAGWRRGVGEALAWGCGAQASPRRDRGRLAGSASHRAIIWAADGSSGLGYKRARGCSGGRAFGVAEVG